MKHLMAFGCLTCLKITQVAITISVFLWLTACDATPGPTPNAVVTSIPTPVAVVPPSPLPSDTPLTAPSFTPADPATPGLVRGQSCYPSERPPPMRLYFSGTTGTSPAVVDLAEGEADFALELPPGEYTAYATTIGTGLRGAYTACLPDDAACTDRRLLPFTIHPGQTISDINLCDWYSPPGPTQPTVSAAASGEAVMVTTLQNMKLFNGPGLSYPALKEIVPGGVSARAVARNRYGDWLQIEQPALFQPAWIYAPLTQVTGAVEQLPLAAEAQQEAALPRDQFMATNWYASPNNEVVHFVGTIRDRQRKRINGYSVLLDNGTWSVLSHPTGASRHYPDIEDGEWDLIITNAADAAGWWALTLVSYNCPDFETGFNAQCKDVTPLSPTKVVKVVYPDKHIISANWICHYNCDQGLYVDAYRKP